MNGKSKNNKYHLHIKDINIPLVLNAGHNSLIEGDQLGWHKHDGYELTFVTKGSVIWEVKNSCDHHLVSGQVSLVSPDTLHRGIDDITLPCEMFWLVFKPWTKEAIINTPFQEEELKHIDQVFRNFDKGVVEITPLISSLLAEFRSSCISYNTIEDKSLINPSIRSLLCQLILQTSLSFQDKRKKNVSNDFRIVQDYINNQFTYDIGIEDIAQLIGKKETYVYSLFKKNTGQTPSEYIQRLRVQHATKMLKETTMSVTKIAYELGFSSSQYFAKVFKKYMGTSPSQFRRIK
ncbi:AraC family transcriptional regulator [Vallitalea okinawensis]|uniref:AraC family transcriptional regulator n=1 Tax=Vallitalea okinawensis TaxID=2078660 RepID=UPI000CFD89B3|nr:AraC family transcriptional regulator [Vallitalea okinawensis]